MNQKNLATTSRFLAWKPNANTGVDRGETSVGIGLAAAVSDMPNTTSEKMTVGSQDRFPQRQLFGTKLDV